MWGAFTDVEADGTCWPIGRYFACGILKLRGGYTKNIRAPESVTGKEKEQNAASYGYTGHLRDVEYDHLLSGVVTV